MPNRSGLAQWCAVGAALGAAALISTNAAAQTLVNPVVTNIQGCCEGGDATGANAWTNGNSTAAAGPADLPTPTKGMIVGKAPPKADTGWWTHGDIEIG